VIRRDVPQPIEITRFQTVVGKVSVSPRAVQEQIDVRPVSNQGCPIGLIIERNVKTQVLTDHRRSRIRDRDDGNRSQYDSFFQALVESMSPKRSRPPERESVGAIAAASPSIVPGSLDATVQGVQELKWLTEH
jgi:hypothetical protein